MRAIQPRLNNGSFHDGFRLVQHKGGWGFADGIPLDREVLPPALERSIDTAVKKRGGLRHLAISSLGYWDNEQC